MKDIKVSIVCITYNQEKYVAQALDGFVTQEADFNFEVIIADDRSSDETPTIINEYAQKYPEIIKPILRKTNVGVQNNLIDALRQSKGEYIALCEGDDFWTDTQKLRRQANFLDVHKDYAIVFHPVRVIFENHEEPDAIFPETTDKKWFTVKNLLEDNYIQTNSVMYRRGDYDHLSSRVMPFDWYLHLTHAKQGRIGFINKTMAAYRRHDGGLWWEMYNNPLEAWKKYGQGYLQLCHEAAKLYGDEPEYKSIIRKHVARVYDAFALGATSDEAYDNLASDSLTLVPSETWMYIKGLIIDKKKLIETNEELRAEHERRIAALEGALEDTRNHVQLLQGELITIKQSKMWRYTTKYRHLKNNIKRLLRG